jgi:hypothetical protein
MRKNFFYILSILFLLTVIPHLWAKIQVSRYRMELMKKGDIHATAPQLPPEVINIFAGEFKGIFADYLLLEVAAFVGANTDSTPEDWEAVSLLFKQTMTLDPHFKQSYRLLQSVLAWRAKKYDLTIELLERARINRPWDWEPGFLIGFNYFYFLKDNQKASEKLMEASKVPNASPMLATLASRLAQKAGQTYNAIVFLKAMNEKTEDEWTKELLETRIKALAGVLILENGIEHFTSRFGRPPESLEELVAKGVLQELPRNPYKKPYLYKDGQIDF